MVSDLISTGEKRQALDRVLASRTFGRSDQLRGFLRYICEAEFEGRAQQLNEYVLGVSGRSSCWASRPKPAKRRSSSTPMRYASPPGRSTRVIPGPSLGT